MKNDFKAVNKINVKTIKDYTITMDLNQYWNDERLMFGNRNDYLILVGDFIDRIWVPDTFIANDKYAYLHEVTEQNKMLKLYGNGDIVRRNFSLDKTSAGEKHIHISFFYKGIRNAFYNHARLYDGFAQLSARLAKLYCGNRKL